MKTQFLANSNVFPVFFPLQKKNNICATFVFPVFYQFLICWRSGPLIKSDFHTKRATLSTINVVGLDWQIGAFGILAKSQTFLTFHKVKGVRQESESDLRRVWFISLMTFCIQKYMTMSMGMCPQAKPTTPPRPPPPCVRCCHVPSMCPLFFLGGWGVPKHPKVKDTHLVRAQIQRAGRQTGAYFWCEYQLYDVTPKKLSFGRFHRDSNGTRVVALSKNSKSQIA